MRRLKPCNAISEQIVVRIKLHQWSRTHADMDDSYQLESCREQQSLEQVIPFNEYLYRPANLSHYAQNENGRPPPIMLGDAQKPTI